VDEDYVNYLRQFDNKVPYVTYGANDKFVCGAVLSINGVNYFAPISSKTKKTQVSTRITDKDGRTLSTIKYNYMFPAPEYVLEEISIADIRRTDPSYANLLQKEYEFCRANEQKLLIKAQKVYNIGLNSKHVLNPTCCDFQLLEEKSKQFFAQMAAEAFGDNEEKNK